MWVSVSVVKLSDILGESSAHASHTEVFEKWVFGSKGKNQGGLGPCPTLLHPVPL